MSGWALEKFWLGAGIQYPLGILCTQTSDELQLLFILDINLNAFDLDTLKIIVRILMIASIQDEKGNYAKGIGKNTHKPLK